MSAETANIRVRKNNERCLVSITIDPSEIESGNLVGAENLVKDIVKAFSDIAQVISDVSGAWVYRDNVTIRILRKPDEPLLVLFNGKDFVERWKDK